MKIELMSPAGNIDSFISAIEGGADSVYLGLKKFNARRPADNFTAYELKKALTYAHNKNVKVYVTLNIDLKSNEMQEAAALLDLLKNINIDAVIVKDPGLINLIRKFYSGNLQMHFSTQCAASSSFGVEFARSQGASRVVLAREMELSEISKACSVNGIECEIFTEGSMCFSVSGRCLMSSWVGGRSGNRGACTAPCRVMWGAKDKKDTFFSMKDLTLIKHIPDIRSSGVAAVKIEGRLKNAHWVRAVTSIYRKAIDGSLSPEETEDLAKELRKFSARETGTGHVFGHDSLTGKNSEWGDFEKAVTDHAKVNPLIDTNTILFRIKEGFVHVEIFFHNNKKELKIKLPHEPKKARLSELSMLEETFREVLQDRTKFSVTIEDKSFMLPATFLRKMTDETITAIRSMQRDEERLPNLSKEILDFIIPKEQNRKRERLLGDMPDKIIISSKNIQKIINKELPVKNIVISLDGAVNVKELETLRKSFALILSIPAVLYEDEAIIMKELISDLVKNRFDSFEANSFTGIELLADIECRKYLGTSMPVMNHLAAGYFNELGFMSVYATPEGDSDLYSLLDKLTPGRIEALVFGRLPLYQTRNNTSFFKDKEIFKDKYGVEIQCHNERGLKIFASVTPLSFIGKKFREQKIHFDSLTADLRYFDDPVTTITDIFDDKLDKNLPSFNFFRKLV
jgi:U32 family peptidase